MLRNVLKKIVYFILSYSFHFIISKILIFSFII